MNFLKIKGPRDDHWKQFGGKRFEWETMNFEYLPPTLDDLFSNIEEPDDNDRFVYVKFQEMDKEGNTKDVEVAFNTIAYLLNDRGDTIQKITVKGANNVGDYQQRESKRQHTSA